MLHACHSILQGGPEELIMCLFSAKKNMQKLLQSNNARSSFNQKGHAWIFLRQCIDGCIPEILQVHQNRDRNDSFGGYGNTAATHNSDKIFHKCNYMYLCMRHGCSLRRRRSTCRHDNAAATSVVTCNNRWWPCHLLVWSTHPQVESGSCSQPLNHSKQRKWITQLRRTCKCMFIVFVTMRKSNYSSSCFPVPWTLSKKLSLALLVRTSCALFAVDR